MTLLDLLLIAGGLWALMAIIQRGQALERQAEAAYRRPYEKGDRHGHQDN